MAEIKKTGSQSVIDYMSRDYDSLLAAMKARIPEKLPEWTDYESEADFGNVLLQLFAHMGDILSYYQDRIANESFLGTATTRRSIIQHLRLIGYRLKTAVPASTKLTLSVPSSYTGTVTIRQGNAFATKSSPDRPSIRFEYTAEHDLTIDFKTVAASGGRKYCEKIIPIEEGRLVKDEIIGTSDGTPNQRFDLARSSIILRPLGQGISKDIVITTKTGTLIEAWTLQESLAYSREGQKDFSIEIDDLGRATVNFGDGAFGRIPSQGAEIKATYRVGGGIKGNVLKNSIQTIIDAPELAVIGARVINPVAATGGADAEEIRHAVMHAPDVFRSLKRAVTAADYVALARDFNGVAKVKARSENWNEVTLIVSPQGGGRVSDVLRANLLAYFEDKRQVTTRVVIEDATYVEVYISADIKIEPYYDEQTVKENVRKAAASLLAFETVDFGSTVYLSKFYDVIEDVDGVVFVTITEFGRDTANPGSVEQDGVITITDDEIPVIPAQGLYTTGINLTVLQDV